MGLQAALLLDNASVDLVASDTPFAQIDQPEHTTAALRRVLDPGVWIICARKANRWGNIGIGANNVMSKRSYVTLTKYLQPQCKEPDVFPTIPS